MAYHCQRLCLLGVFLGPASSVTGVADGGQSTPRAVFQPLPHFVWRDTDRLGDGGRVHVTVLMASPGKCVPVQLLCH